MYSSRLALCAAAALLSSVSCRKQASAPPGPPPRYAVLRFENLSGDPSLDPAGRAVSEALPVMLNNALDGPVLQPSALSRSGTGLGPRPSGAPGISTERAAALAAGMNRAVEGYIDRVSGKVEISAAVEDLISGKTLRTASGSGPDTLAALRSLASRLTSRPGSSPTTSNEALRDYAVALEAPVDQSRPALQQAVQLDPAFGPAWVTIIRSSVAQNDRASAQSAIENARQQKLDAFDRARIDLDAANLAGDRSAAISAESRLLDLSPADLNLARQLADSATNAGNFKVAEAAWKKLLVSVPDDPVALNSVGYVRSYQGDYSGALAALNESRRILPNDANPVDSIGDLNYTFRRFNEAAAAYLDAAGKQPGSDQAGELYKAAWAKYYAGDKSGADQLFTRFFDSRQKTAGDLAILMRGDWLYRTGREAEAVQLLRTLLAANQNPQVRSNGYAQLIIWDLLSNDRAQAAKDAVMLGDRQLDASMLPARFAALPSASVEEWQQRAAKMLPPNLAGLRTLVLGYALVLDSKRDAALPVWRQIVQNGNATDFFSQGVLARLEGKPVDHPSLPTPSNVNQFAGLLDKL